MVIHPNRLPWALAGALCLLASCAPPTAGPAPSASPSAPAAMPSEVGTAAPASPAASAPGSAEPTAAPSAAPSAAVTATPAPGSYPTGILRGTVYDGDLKLVPDGTAVTVKSMDAARPYEATVQTASGAYVANGVPLDTQVQVTATRPGWTTRTQVGVVRPYDPRFESTNVINFGGRATAEDRRGVSYFLSDHPEISRVEPTDGDSSLPREELSFKLHLSEALDSENRRRLAAAFLIVPNNDEALGDEMAISDLVDDDEELEGLRLEDPADDATGVKYPYAYRQNAAFLNGAEVSSFVWAEDGRSATFMLKAPMKTGRDDEGEYAFLLRQADDDPIVDEDGNPLGMNKSGEFGKTTRGQIIYNAVVEPSVNLTEGFDDEEERWADTHLSYTTFTVEEDSVAPTITSVVARRNFVDDDGDAVDRIEITFSEPMIAYPRIASPGLLSLDNYVLSVRPTEKELEALNLRDGGSFDEVGTGANGETVRDEFEGAVGVRINSSRAEAGNFRVALSVRDPRVVIFELPEGSFPLDGDYIAVVAGAGGGTDNDVVGDPAENPIAASDRVKIGPIY